jgi:hypothetical protein
MTRYLRQRDTFRCGPVAVLNLAKWQGIRATREHLAAYTQLCKCRKNKGTYSTNLSYAVGKRGRQMSYDEFKRRIEAGRSAIVLTHAMRRSQGASRYKHGHYYFVPALGTRTDDASGKIIECGFLAVNFIDTETKTIISWPYMKWLLKHSTVWSFK